MKKWLLGIILIIALVISLSIYIRFQTWKRNTLSRLNSNSLVIETVQGTIEYSVVGEGPSIIILHGLKGGYDQGLVPIDLINDEQFKMIAISRPGYLRTPLSTGRSVVEQADAMAAFLDTMGIKKTAVIAQSIGGPYAIEFALKYPDRCWGLVLLSAVTMPGEDIQPSFLERIISLLVDSDFGNWLMLSMLDKWPDQMIPLVIADPDHRSMVINNPVKMKSITDSALSLALSSLRKTGSKNDQWQIINMQQLPLGDVEVPVLIIAGTGDDLVEDATYFANQNPETKLVLIEGGDHSTFLVFSDDLVPQVRDFLKSNAPTN